ncbi:MAG: protein translocase subunit SecDF [Bacteroidota bacterium]
MQNKGAIKFFAIAFALVCLFQLSFTYFTNHTESKASDYATTETVTAQAKELAKGDAIKEKLIYDSLVKDKEDFYLDSMQNEVVFNFLWIRKYTYKDCKDREINLGLDLKGGMNVTLEISVIDVIREMANNSKNPVFTKALDLASEMEKTSTKDFVTLFGESIKEIDPGFKLSSIFNTVELKDKINYNSSNDEVLAIIKTETDDAIDRTYNILRTRIDRFGVTQPNIQKLSTAGRILVELPGIKDPNRVRKLLQGTAKLEFWKTWDVQDVYSQLEAANTKLAEFSKVGDTALVSDTALADTTLKTTATKTIDDDTAKDNTTDTTTSLVNKLKQDTAGSKDLAAKESFDQYAKENPLFAYLRPNLQQGEDGKYYLGKGPNVGYSLVIDTPKVNKMLNLANDKNLFKNDIRFLWEVKPFDDNKSMLWLIAIKVDDREGKSALDGTVITDAYQDFDQNSQNVISMTMNSEGASTWKRLTGDNIGKSIAIVLDNYVYSYPVVQGEIPNGHSQITGNFTLEEAKDLANVLKAGKLPAPAKIVEESIVGPTLGQEAINSGLWSFIAAFVLTLLYMIFYYHKAGLVADIALFVNMFFVFGILASLGAVLTLPGIAGLVLTLGMDVDKNVIIYERVREEIRAGKGIRLAINDGYKHAYSSIIDSNVTTLLTGIVLYIFGSGPIQGFATTLIIGIISSLFCAIFITRLVFLWMMDKNWTITVWSNATKNILTKVRIDFIGIRKKYYILSLALVAVGIISLSYRGVSYGIDFLGGRTYVVRFDQDVMTDEIRTSLGNVFGDKPEVKTFGPNNQVKITTSFMIDDKTTKADSIVETKLFNGLKSFYNTSISLDDFISHEEDKVLGKLSSQKVEPTIAYSLLQKAYLAIFFSLLIIFIYIAIRFRKWQWGLGAVISLFHDTFIVVTVFSLLYGVLPFTLEIDQHFIAALLTIIGYSIMDSVIIFDRIREYQTLYPKRELKSNMNDAINSTLSRTLNTSGITFMVLLAMFIFGGEVIRGFTFALMIGVLIGTYSSVLNATPIAYDTIQWLERRKARKEQKKI